MPEIGLLPFGAWRWMWRLRFCRLIAAVLVSTKFTQPQLLAVLCLMRYED